MRLETVEQTLFIGSVLLTLVLLWRLWKQRLHVEYRFLALYLAWDAIGALFVSLSPRKTMAYFYTYTAMRFVQWILEVLVTLDLVSLITKRYAGITSVARVAVSVCLSIAAGAALLSAMIDLSTGPAQSPILKVSQLVDRTISFSVLSFLLLMLIFLLWFPINLSRNTVAYASGFIVMFAAMFSVDLMSNLLDQPSFQALGTIQLAVFVVILIYWSLRITVRNEKIQTTVGHAWNRTAERRLVSQLESINESLLRGGGKPNPR